MSLQTYNGSCHCGAVRYMTSLDISSIIECNCSMCGRSGTILSFVPESQFTLESGSEFLTDYQFHKEHIHHVFCNVCGIKPFAHGKTEDGSSMYAVNVRCLEGINVHELHPKQVDGRSL